MGHAKCKTKNPGKKKRRRRWTGEKGLRDCLLGSGPVSKLSKIVVWPEILGIPAVINERFPLSFRRVDDVQRRSRHFE